MQHPPTAFSIGGPNLGSTVRVRDVRSGGDGQRRPTFRKETAFQ